MSKLTKKQKTEIEKLASMSDGEIDTSEIPEMADWENPVIGNSTGLSKNRSLYAWMLICSSGSKFKAANIRLILIRFYAVIWKLSRQVNNAIGFSRIVFYQAFISSI